MFALDMELITCLLFHYLCFFFYSQFAVTIITQSVVSFGYLMLSRIAVVHVALHLACPSAEIALKEEIT